MFVQANAELEKQFIEARAGIAYPPTLAIKQWFGRKSGSDRIGWRRKTVLLMRLDLAVAQIDAAAYPDRKTLRPIEGWDWLLKSDQTLGQKLVEHYDDPDHPR